MGEININVDRKLGHTSIQIKQLSNNDVTDAITSLVTALSKELVEQALKDKKTPNGVSAKTISVGLPLLLKMAFKVLSEVTERIPDSCLNKMLTDKGIDDAGLKQDKPLGEQVTPKDLDELLNKIRNNKKDSPDKGDSNVEINKNDRN